MMNINLILISTLFVLTTYSKLILPKSYFTEFNNELINRSKREVIKDSYTLDVFVIVDSTYSQNKYVPQIKESLIDIMQHVTSLNPKNRFGLSLTYDKPITPFGHNSSSWKEKCFKILSSLDDSVETTRANIDSIVAGGGYDFAEAQLEGLMRALLSDKVGWRTEKFNEDGSRHIKILMLLTDSFPHLPEDALTVYSDEFLEKLTTPVLKKFNIEEVKAGMKSEDENFGCAEYNYPSPKDIGNLLREKSIIPFFVLQPAGYPCTLNNSLCPYPDMKYRAHVTGDDIYLSPTGAMNKVYGDLVEELNIPTVLTEVKENFIDLGTKFEHALDEVNYFLRKCKSIPQGDSKQDPCFVLSEKNSSEDELETTTTTTTTKPTTTTTIPTTTLKYEEQPNASLLPNVVMNTEVKPCNDSKDTDSDDPELSNSEEIRSDISPDEETKLVIEDENEDSQTRESHLLSTELSTSPNISKDTEENTTTLPSNAKVEFTNIAEEKETRRQESENTLANADLTDESLKESSVCSNSCSADKGATCSDCCDLEISVDIDIKKKPRAE